MLMEPKYLYLETDLKLRRSFILILSVTPEVIVSQQINPEVG